MKMNNMTQEEKAKRYDYLLVKLQEAKVDNDVCDDRYCCVIDDIVPELKESEDEGLRKEIIDFATKANNGVISILANNYNFNKWLAWLEKQGAQKPSWSEKDREI